MYFIGLDVQEDDRLLREGCGWLCVEGRQDWLHAAGSAYLAVDFAQAPNVRDGDDHLYRVNL